MRYLLLLIPAMALAQAPPKTSWDTRMNGAPTTGCSSSQDVGKRYSRINAAAANATLYVCSNTGASTYAWALSGGTPDTSVYLTRATDQAGTDRYCRSTTGDDTYVCSVTPTLTAYTRGMIISLDPDTANTLTASININSLGAVQILTRDGSALATGDVAANRGSSLYYNGTTFSLMGSASSATVTAGTGIAVAGSEVSINSAVTQTRANDQTGTNLYGRSTTGNDTYVVALNPALTALTRGMVIRLDPDTANTLTASLNIDGLGAIQILTRAGAALATGDITADRGTELYYNGTTFNIIGDGGGSTTPTLLDVYPPFGFPTGAEIAFNPGATVVKAYSFTPTLNLSFTKIAWTGSGAGYVSFGIWSFDGTTKVTNSAAVCLSPGTGNGAVCSFAGTVALTAGTTYRLAWAADAATGQYVSNGGNLAYNSGSGSGWPFSFGSVAIGTAANVSSSSGATLALPATLGTISAVTGSISHNAYPPVVFIP